MLLTRLCPVVLWGLLTSCGTFQPAPDLGGLYNELAQQEDPQRNPVIVIPGVLGSRLVDETTGAVAWGAFGFGQVNPNSVQGARLVALPMASGRSLRELRDGVRPDGALDRVIVNFVGVPVQLNAYYNILRALGVGGYRDQQLAEAGAIDYGEEHFTCFQFAYDWRRDIVESAQALDRFILAKKAEVKREIERRYGVKRDDLKFDLVAHSMGGLVARYYLRYGSADLPDDGSLPELTWEGARHVEHLIMVGTPNAGSVDTIESLVRGMRPAFLFPKYSAAVQGTMPSVYQLLPRSRHRPLLDSKGKPVDDLLDPGLWERNQWGLVDPGQAEVLEILLPEISDPEERRQVALDHQRKALARARRFTQALDVAATPPPWVRLYLVAGDAVATKKTLQFDGEGALRVVETGPGDGTVLRSSALMDERAARKGDQRLESPIAWSQVLFLFSDHLEITEDPAFIDNVLYFLLESPRAGDSGKATPG
ncbi:MAG: esterase/lipase family protein [Nitrospiraceae bacterium]